MSLKVAFRTVTLREQWAKPAEGTVPLYLYGKIENRRRKAPDILALDFNERGYGSPAIYYAGVAGYVFKDKRSGTVPVTQRQHGKTDGLGYAPGPDFGPGKAGSRSPPVSRPRASSLAARMSAASPRRR